MVKIPSNMAYLVDFVISYIIKIQMHMMKKDLEDNK
jgi:hypothetical protein